VHLAAVAMIGPKLRAALRVYRRAHRINPNLDGVAETIRALENALGEEGRKDDKK